MSVGIDLVLSIIVILIVIVAVSIIWPLLLGAACYLRLLE